MKKHIAIILDRAGFKKIQTDQFFDGISFVTGIKAGEHVTLELHFDSTIFSSADARLWCSQFGYVYQDFNAADELIPASQMPGVDIVFVALADKKAPKKILLFPEGTVRTTKTPDLIMDQEGGEAAVERFNDLGRDMVIDYHHQTVDGSDKAPAAGWVNKLSYEAGVGLWAHVRKWTDTASEFIENEEYKYYSPVILFNKKTKRIFGVMNIALTNEPATKNIEAIAASAISILNPNFNLNQGDAEMLKLLCAFFWLPADSTEKVIEAKLKDIKDGTTLATLNQSLTDLEAKVNDQKDGSEDLKAVALAVGLKEDAKKEDIIQKLKDINTVKDSTEKALLSVTDRLNAVEKTQLVNTTDKLVTDAMELGKLTAAERDEWGNDMAEKNPELFTKMMLTRQVQVPLEDVILGKDTTTTKLSAEDKEVARQMDVPLELLTGKKE